MEWMRADLSGGINKDRMSGFSRGGGVPNSASLTCFNSQASKRVTVHGCPVT